MYIFNFFREIDELFSAQTLFMFYHDNLVFFSFGKINV